MFCCRCCRPCGTASAHEGEHHAAEPMKTLHHTMKALPGNEESIRQAVVRGDYKTALKESEKMRKLSSALLKTVPHKNADDIAGYRAAGASFQASADVLNDALKSGDAERVRDAMKRVGKSCNACHAKFRD